MGQEMFLHRFRIAKPYQRSLCEVIRCTILYRRQQTALLYALKLNYVKSSRVIQMWVSRVLEPQHESTAQTVSGCSPYSKWRPPQGKEAPCFITILLPFGKLFFSFFIDLSFLRHNYSSSNFSFGITGQNLDRYLGICWLKDLQNYFVQTGNPGKLYMW